MPRRSPTSFALALCLALATCANAATWYVDDVTDPAENGSVLHPFNAIQEGLNAASNGDTVLVKNGTYRGAGNKNLDFYGKQIVLHGQFGPANTKIDCEGVGRGFFIHSGETTNTVIRGLHITGANTAITNTVGNPGDPFYGIYYGETPSAIYCVSNSGFTLDNCFITDSQAMTYRTETVIGDPGDPFYAVTRTSDGSGGAIHCEGCDMVIRNSMLSGNRAGLHGGGIYMSQSTARIETVIMSVNTASVSRSQSTLTIGDPGDPYYSQTHTVTAPGAGGGIYAEESELNVSGCLISSNVAGFAGGGVCVISNAPLVVTGCAIEGNSLLATDPACAGGGIAVFSGDARIGQTTIQHNDAPGLHTETTLTIGDPGDFFYSQMISRSFTGQGGGIYIENVSTGVIKDCALRLNAAGLAGGALAARNVASLTISNCLLEGNSVSDNTTPGRGGAASIDNASFNIESSAFIRNTSGDVSSHTMLNFGELEDEVFLVHDERAGSGNGGGLALDSATGTIASTEFADNVSHYRGGAIFASGNSVLQSDRLAISSNSSVSANFVDVLTLHNLYFWERSSHEIHHDGLGGGIYLDASTLYCSRSVFRGNEAGGRGGGLHLTNAFVALENVMLLENTAGSEVSSSITSNGFDNSITMSSYTFGSTGVGAVAYFADSTQQWINCTAWNNHGDTNWGGIYVATGSVLSLLNTIVWSNALFAEETTSVAAAYSVIESGWTGAGNQSVDPDLTLPGRLRATSPCIDAGTDAGVPGADWEKEARVDHPLHPDLFSIVDIGADEFVDTDADDIADAWEYDVIGDLVSADNTTDGDMDQLTDLDEYNHSTEPANADTDGDFLPDGWELFRGLNPLQREQEEDPDADGYLTTDEYIADTDPLDSDSYLHLLAIRVAAQPDAVALGLITSTQRIYRIESADVLDTTWLEVTNLFGAGAFQFIDVESVSPTRSFQVKAELP